MDTGSSRNDVLHHKIRPCPECGGTDRRESKPGNVILTSHGCGYRAEFEATALRAIGSREEH